MKKKEVVKILEDNELTNIYPTTTNNVVGERIKAEDLSEPVKDLLKEETLESQKEELEDSLKQSLHQELIRKEMDKIRAEGWKEESTTDTHKIIYEAERRVKGTYVHQTESEKMQEELEPLPLCPMADD